jgi:DNA polymerase
MNGTKSTPLKTTDNLKWQVEMGADEAMADAPVNRLKTPAPKAEPALPVTKAAEVKLAPAVHAPTTSLVGKARDLAQKAQTLEELKTAVESFDGLAICKTANKTVFAEGNPKAKVMLIGEAPGANEDLEGVPFCGASGKLLDNMLATIGLSRKENAYITNTIFWRPPGNRRPTPEELEICRPFVERHIALLDPALLVMVGGTAAAALVDDQTNVSRLRGKELELQLASTKQAYPVIVTFHPSYLLRSPQQKRLAWQDMLFIQQCMEKRGLAPKGL